MSEQDDKLDLYNQFLANAEPDSRPKEDPVDPAAQYTNWAQQPVSESVYPTMAAAIPKAMVMQMEDPDYTERTILNTIGAKWRSWARPYALPFVAVEEMTMAWGKGTYDPKTIDGIGEDMASFGELRDMFSKKGMTLDIDQRDFTEQLVRKARSELGPDWRGKLKPEDEDKLIGGLGLSIAVANARIRHDVRRDFVTARWQTMYDSFKKSFPGYGADLHEFTQDVKQLELVEEAWTHGTVEDSLAVSPEHMYRLYQGITGQEWDADWNKIGSTLVPVTNALRKTRTQANESLKWQRLGVGIPPEAIVQEQHELPVSEIPFITEQVNKYTTARALGISHTDQETQAWDNVYSSLRETLAGKDAELVLSPLFALADTQAEKPARSAGVPLGLPITFQATGQRERWTALDAAIRKEPDPSAKFRKLIQGINTDGNAAQKEWFKNTLAEKHATNVVDQRATLLQLEMNEPQWNPDVAQARASESRSYRAAQIEMDAALAKQMESVPLLSAISWMQNAVSFIVDKSGVSKVDELLALPIGEALLNETLRTGLSKIEQRYSDRAGSLGAYVNRKLGTENIYQDWASIYAEKKLLGQAGYWDDAAFAGGAILSMFLETPGFAVDSPAQFVAFSKVISKVHAARTPVGEAMGRAGVPQSIRGIVELGMDPLAPGHAFNTFVGRTPEVVRQLGAGQREFRRGLKSSNPEYASAAIANANKWKDVMQREGIIRDQTRVDAANATYAGLLSRAANGQRITLQSIQDMARLLDGESQEMTRRMFAPWQRQGESYHLRLNKAAYNQEIRDLVEREQGIERAVEQRKQEAFRQRDLTRIRLDREQEAGASDADLTQSEVNAEIRAGELDQVAHDNAIAAAAQFKTMSQLGTEAYNAYATGKYNDWVKSFDSGLGSLFPKAVRDEVMALVDRRIQLHDTQVHTDPVALEISYRLAEQKSDMLTVKALHELTIQRAGLEAARRRSNADLSEFTLRMQIATQQQLAWGGRATDARAMQPGIDALTEQIKVERKLAFDTKELSDMIGIEKRRLAQKGWAKTTYISNGAAEPVNANSVGLDQGHTTSLSLEQRRVSNDYLHDTAIYTPHEMGLHSVGQRVHEVATETAAEWRRTTAGLVRDQRALNIAENHYMMNDFRQAVAVLSGARIRTVQTDASVIKGIERLRKRIAKEDAEKLDASREQFHKRMEKIKAYDIRPLDTDLTEVITQVRRKVSEFRTLGSERSSPIATPADMNINPSGSLYRRVVDAAGRMRVRLNPGRSVAELLPRPAYEVTGRMMGMLAQQTDSSAHEIKKLTEDIKDGGHLLSLADQRTLALVNTLHPSAWPVTLPQQIRNIASMQRYVQDRVINQAESIGEISKEEARRLRSGDYEDRFYVTREYRKQLEERGMALHADTLTESMRMAPSAPLMRFQPAASQQYARVVYRDWAGNEGKWTAREFPVGNSIRDANTEAARFLADLIQRKRVHEGEYLPVVEAVSSVAEAIQGKITTTHELRADSMSKLYTEVMRREFFAQVAQFGGLVRDSENHIPVTERGNWEFVKGTEWGTLNGRWVSKSLIKQMNAWTGYTHVLDSIVKGIQDSLRVAGADARSLGMIEKRTKDGVLDKLDTHARHNYMMGNIATWVSNVVGGVTGAFFGGANVAHPKYWYHFSEGYTKLYENFAETQRIAAAHKVAGIESVETEFIESVLYGFIQRAPDTPGMSVDSSVSGVRKILNSVVKRDQIELSRLLQQAASWDEVRTNTFNELMIGTGTTPVQRRKLADTMQMADAMYREIHAEAISRATRFGLLHEIDTMGSLEFQKGLSHVALKEATDFFADPDHSVIRGALGSRYSQIDSKNKWAFFRYLRDIEGVPKEAAFERVAHFAQNFGGVGPWVRSLREMRIMGAFVPGFPAEAARNIYNSLRENPGRVINMFSTIMAWNAGVLYSKNMLPSDMNQLGGDENSMDYMLRMAGTLMFPIPGGITSIDISQWMNFSPFIKPAGATKPVVAQINKYMEEKAGAISLPAQMLLNYITNFVVNTPVTSTLEKHVLGVDSWNGELTYNKSTMGETASRMWKEALAYVAPATLVRGYQSYSDYNDGPVSLLTKYNRSALDRIARGVGVNVREYTRNSANAQIIVQNAGPKIMAEMYVDGLGADEKEYKRTLLRLDESMRRNDPETYKADFKRAMELKKQFLEDIRTVGGQRVDYSVKDPEKLRDLVVAEVGANLQQTIERLPIHKSVNTLVQLLANSASPDDPAVNHLVQSLTNELYLKTKDNVVEIIDGARQAYDVSILTTEPSRKEMFTAISLRLINRLKEIKSEAKLPAQVNAMNTKLGQMPEYFHKMMAAQIGL